MTDAILAPHDSPRSTTVSVRATEQWEKELLLDPKVCRFSLEEP